MAKLKPILMGQNNPLSTRSGHELYPAPDGCSGHRLWQMLNERTGASRRAYLDSFDRRNLVVARTYDRTHARARAYELMCELRDSGRTIVLLGQEVRAAFDFVLKSAAPFQLGDKPIGLPPLIIHPQEAGGCTWRQIPHPSGRNLWYNDPENRKVVELLLEELYVEYRKEEAGMAAD